MINTNKSTRINWLKNGTLLIAGLILSTGSTINAKEQDYSRTQKELKIMSTIFETSLADKNIKTQNILGSKRTQATYLADQGMLFSFDFSKNLFASNDDWAMFGEGIGQFVGEIASEVGAALADMPNPPRVPRAPDMSFDFEEHFREYEDKREALEEMREQQQQQREQVRELQIEIRRMERDKDEANNEPGKIDSIKKQLEQKIAVLNQKMNEYNQSMEEYRAQRDKKNNESSKLKSETILATLCDYGTTLRALKDDEHVTIIFNHYAENKAQIYVFDIKDVRNCDSKDKLLKTAISYQM